MIFFGGKIKVENRNAERGKRKSDEFGNKEVQYFFFPKISALRAPLSDFLKEKSPAF